MGLMLYKRFQRDTWSLSSCEDTAKVAAYEPGRGMSPECDHGRTLILDLLVPRPFRGTCLLFIRYPVCVVIAAQIDLRQIPSA